MTNIPVGRPWQMIAVDVLEVPLSLNNNRYLLVVQEYFTKWADAIPIPDQKATRITKELVKLFCIVGLPDILHSDQGRNFESSILKQTLVAFGVEKSHTTAYHPQCDGMVERFNRSLLQLLRSYVDRNEDWERYLPLLLYAYRTAIHSTTGVSPFVLMYGCQPKTAFFSPNTAFDVNSYQAHLQRKLAELRDFVDLNLSQSAHSQKSFYDNHSQLRSFKSGTAVWLSVPTAGKLEPRWEGNWTVCSAKTPVSIEITDGQKTKVVHVNRLRLRIQPEQNETLRENPKNGQTAKEWEAPQVEHFNMPSEIHTPTQRYLKRIRHPPDRFQPCTV